MSNAFDKYLELAEKIRLKGIRGEKITPEDRSELKKLLKKVKKAAKKQ